MTEHNKKQIKELYDNGLGQMATFLYLAKTLYNGREDNPTLFEIIGKEVN